MKGRAVQRAKLSKKLQEEMYLLLSKNFLGVEKNVFENDLQEKNWVVLIENDQGKLLGFSTILLYRTEYQGKKFCVIYSGDTIMERSAWGSFSMPKVWIKTIKEICKPNDNEQVVWFLITSGFRTYRFLPVFWQKFYPCYNKITPPDVQGLMDHIGSKQFGPLYNKNTGIVKFPHPQSLIEELNRVPAGKLSDPHVNYFNTLNPGHIHGDELVCIADLNDSNLNAAGRRMLYSETLSPEIA